jgi:osmotically-inducible protein OsmY
MKTKPMRTAAIAAIAALAGLALAACDRTATDDRTVGQKLDRAVEKTQQKLAEAGEKTRETIKEAAPKVEQKLDAAGQRIAEATDKVVDRTREATRDARDTTVSTARDARDTTVSTARDARAEASNGDTGRAMSDTAITASIKTDFLKDPDLSVLKIDVDTRGGVVTLNGLAENEAAKQRAEKMASAVKGVREVRNHLTVKRV